ncbi:MAG: 1-acyl-sn-glycerol-3-phosphate acyltransferase [Bacteroidia bacterium]|nr:1-acyl-sn-glycerol-3-phosphate acyltransferase [Bacteroidia bacterium]
MKILRILHTYYGLTVFGILFILFLPLLLIPIIFPKQFQLIGIFNRWWAKILFILTFLPFRVECQAKLDSTKQYVFCPNHFSYLDIPTMGLNPINTIFVGKSEMENIPLFGFMYSRLHITVDRSKLKSKFITLQRSLEALDQGKSLVIYPEGGIITHHPPHIVKFKDGAFRAAIERQVSIVPVTIPYNWIIMPDPPKYLHPRKIVVIFHEPIETKGMTRQNVDELKKRVFEVIQGELQKHNPALVPHVA